MFELLNSKEMQIADKQTIDNGTPSILLMERAGIAIFNKVKKYIKKEDEVLIICSNGGNAVDAFDENLATIPDELQPPVDTAGENADEEGELDLSGAGDSDLMDMLSESDELSDLGDLLSSAQDDRPVEEGDSIGEFAQSEMDAQEQEMEEQESSDTSKKSKRDKKSKNTDGEPKGESYRADTAGYCQPASCGRLSTYMV